MTHPFATTVTVPVKGARVSHLPIVFVGPPEGVQIDQSALTWAMLLSQRYKLPTVEVRITTLVNFLNFFHLFCGNVPFEVEEKVLSISAYLGWRIEGTADLPRSNPLRKLAWKGIGKQAASNEFSYLAQYFEHASGNQFEIGTLLTRRAEAVEISRKIVRRKGDGGFFAHLKRAQDYWAMHHPFIREVPIWARVDNYTDQYRPHPTIEEVLDIIRLETNPVFRALWIALTFGSHRLSEFLNVWQQDILPGRYRANFFGSNKGHGTTLILMAHPEDSTYLGETGFRKGCTRNEYLRKKYGLLPRSMLPRSDKLRAGWKSMDMRGYRITADTFWLHPNAAKAFDECARVIQNFHLLHRTSTHHPYFFVNMFGSGDSLGQPLRISRVNKAWIAACRRAGVEPHKNGRNIQGLRHLAKWIAEQLLEMHPLDIQRVRGDKSINSQSAYARDAAFLHKRLTETQPNERLLDASRPERALKH